MMAVSCVVNLVGVICTQPLLMVSDDSVVAVHAGDAVPAVGMMRHCTYGALALWLVVGLASRGDLARV
jgi:hypothetical protein